MKTPRPRKINCLCVYEVTELYDSVTEVQRIAIIHEQDCEWATEQLRIQEEMDEQIRQMHWEDAVIDGIFDNEEELSDTERL